MPLRPASPVQLVTRALRSIPPAYQTSVWHAGRIYCTVATFGTHRAAAFAAGTEYAGSAGTGMPYLRARRKQGHAVGNSRDRPTFGASIIGPPVAASMTACDPDPQSPASRRCWGRCGMSQAATDTGQQSLIACQNCLTLCRLYLTRRPYSLTRRVLWIYLPRKRAVGAR